MPYADLLPSLLDNQMDVVSPGKVYQSPFTEANFFFKQMTKQSAFRVQWVHLFPWLCEITGLEMLQLLSKKEKCLKLARGLLVVLVIFFLSLRAFWVFFLLYLFLVEYQKASKKVNVQEKRKKIIVDVIENWCDVVESMI